MDKVAYCCSWYAMQVELTNLLDAVQQTETKMVEMSALNHLMSTHVLQQAQQIEQLYDQVTRYMICWSIHRSCLLSAPSNLPLKWWYMFKSYTKS